MTAAPLLELKSGKSVLIEANAIVHRFRDLALAAFRDRAAGWVASGVAAPFVRILGVSDLTPAELVEYEARRAAKRAANL